MRAPLPIGPTGPTGAYGASRGDGVTHYGYDIRGAPGDDVVAPEDLEVLHVAVDDVTRPLAGYGPGAILGRGASGLYHVLGHMDPWAWSGADAAALPFVGRRYAEGEKIGEVSRLNHVHWEIRTSELPARGAARGAATIDPIAWLRGVRRSFGRGSSELVAVLVALYLLTRE